MKYSGFSLIELIVFITVVASSIALVLPILTALRNEGTISNQTKAQQIAQARMELILEQRAILGFSALADPCAGASPPAACTPPSGYSVSAGIVQDWSGSTTEYKVITVDVTGLAEAHLTSLMANY